MDQTSTLDELRQFIIEEKSLLREVGLEDEKSDDLKEQTIENILNFSKAYSSRPSKRFKSIEMILN